VGEGIRFSSRIHGGCEVLLFFSSGFHISFAQSFEEWLFIWSQLDRTHSFFTGSSRPFSQPFRKSEFATNKRNKFDSKDSRVEQMC
jgi:hypothetical protein